ncbi:MAG TPA: hypothetical protein VN626_10730 [Clostridia bacterium]|nr:hypothetical protein [Clostridia bacterium]
MKRSTTAMFCAAVLMAIINLAACGQVQSLPKPAVELPADLSSFTTVKYDYNYDTGAYKYEFELSKSQQESYLKLLQADKWVDPGELPGRGYTPILDAVNGAGWNLTVGYWDEEHTIIGVFNDDQTEKIFYFAPIEVQKDAMAFKEVLSQTESGSSARSL